ncbi:MAG: 23S rRNA (pseudouridine(1915)-N(3))-methyltransferase RlmH [Bacteroidales bacterium]|nr:23S rRNA (pseudouridine(1915)-N(3))-methyltransferase RlmH [Bacteroidales bacterium]MBD5235934.1 23S rRNA (pseudouridine(1915)-N(3))-methyltransferase RlmH [Bacteroidales bacterium]MBD5237848.1 23S rRNA (pseudouridine(1915)-N(3))-methyltransferase RlmH [Bacteroidales bacterium]
MEIVLLTVGKTTIDFVLDGIAEYTKRLKHYVPYSIQMLPDIKKTASLSVERQKEAEGEMIISKLLPGDHVILLDERGKEYSSMEFATFLEKQMVAGRKRLIFVVGGPYGFSRAVYDRADGKISLSKMTFNHEMVRLFFTEQVYRAMTILRGEPYHHE